MKRSKEEIQLIQDWLKLAKENSWSLGLKLKPNIPPITQSAFCANPAPKDT